MKKVHVIGAGIVGLAISYKLLKANPGLDLTIFEKESEIGKHQSGRNSGVLHCGLYYKPGSLKARLAVNGIREMTRFCAENEVAHDICGKVVVASDEREAKFLDDLYKRGQKNGLKGLKFLSKDELNQREPFVSAHKALLVPEEGIVDYKDVMRKMLKQIIELGGSILYNQDVLSLESNHLNDILLTQEADYIINCTGLYSDIVFKEFTKQDRPFRIVPFRGDYYELTDNAKKLVNHLIYPVPDPQFPFLGVHFTRMIDGGREVGPNAVLAFKREGYKFTDFSLNETFDSVLYKGLNKFIFSNFKFSLGEFQTSLFKSNFLTKAKKLVPDITEQDIVKGPAGVRAQAMGKNGELIMDFKIQTYNNQIHVLNAPSPGATSSLAIASYIIENYIQDLS